MKFEASGKFTNALGSIADSIEGKLSIQRSTDVPIEWCNGHVKFLKKGLVHVHHGKIEAHKYEW